MPPYNATASSAPAGLRQPHLAPPISRRSLLLQAGAGFGLLPLADLFAAADDNKL